jgi:hypothetical protein
VHAVVHRTCGRTEIEEEDTSGSDAEPVVLVPIAGLDAWVLSRAAARVNGERGEGVSGHHTRAAAASRLRVRAHVGSREGRGGRSARWACAHHGAVSAALSPVVSRAPTRNGEKVSPRIVRTRTLCSQTSAYGRERARGRWGRRRRRR